MGHDAGSVRVDIFSRHLDDARRTSSARLGQSPALSSDTLHALRVVMDLLAQRRSLPGLPAAAVSKDVARHITVDGQPKGVQLVERRTGVALTKAGVPGFPGTLGATPPARVSAAKPDETLLPRVLPPPLGPPEPLPLPAADAAQTLSNGSGMGGSEASLDAAMRVLRSLAGGVFARLFCPVTGHLLRIEEPMTSHFTPRPRGDFPALQSCMRGSCSTLALKSEDVASVEHDATSPFPKQLRYVVEGESRLDGYCDSIPHNLKASAAAASAVSGEGSLATCAAHFPLSLGQLPQPPASANHVSGAADHDHSPGSLPWLAASGDFAPRFKFEGLATSKPEAASADLAPASSALGPAIKMTSECYHVSALVDSDIRALRDAYAAAGYSLLNSASSMSSQQIRERATLTGIVYTDVTSLLTDQSRIPNAADFGKWSKIIFGEEFKRYRAFGDAYYPVTKTRAFPGPACLC